MYDGVGQVLRDCPEPEEEWEDATAAFRAATGKLHPDQMVHEADFDLHEVMSALEIMDEKMDSGLGYATRETLTELVERDAVLREPSDEELVRVMEHMLRCEATWLDGRMLPQTLFTCVYFHDHELALRSPPLHLYVAAVARGVSAVADVVITGDVREEEEFSPVLFAVECHADAPLKSIAEELKEAEESIARRLRDAGGEEASPVLHEVLCFIRLRINLLVAFQQLDLGPEGRGAAIRALERARGELQSVDRLHRGSGRDAGPVAGAFFDEARHWVASATVLKRVEQTPWSAAVSLLSRIIDEHIALCAVWDHPALAPLTRFVEGFAERSPPPSIVSRSRLMLLVWDEEKVLGRRVPELVCECLDADYGAPLYSQLLREPKTACCISQQEGNNPENEQLGFTSHQAHLESFLEQVQRCVLQHFFALCHNRARLRRRLANLFAEWGVVQQCAWDCERGVFDGMLAADVTLPRELAQTLLLLSAFVFDWVLHSMDLFLRLGFELDLYSPGEYRYIMWYSEYLRVFRADNTTHLHKTRELTRDELAALRPPPPRGARGAKSRARPQAPLPPCFTSRRVTEPGPCRVGAEHVGILATRGVVKFLAAGELCNLLRDPGGERRFRYCSRAKRYEHRLLPFMQLVKPNFVRYDTFVQHSSTGGKGPKALLGEACWNFEQARMESERLLAEAERVPAGDPRRHPAAEAVLATTLRCVKGNKVSAMLLHRLIAAVPDDPPSPDMSQHGRLTADWSFSRQLPVLKLAKDRPKAAEGAPAAPAAAR